MRLSRASLAGLLCVAFVVVVAATCFAQDEPPESIYIASKKVITIRDKGDHSSVRARSVAVEKAITEITSTQDTQNLDITMRETDGLWTIYSGDIKIVSVYPGEAKTNNVPPRSLAAMWVKNLRTQFPLSTPCSKLPASSFQPAPGASSTPPTAPVTPAAPVAAAPAPVAPITAAPTPAPVPAPTPVPTGPVTGAPELLVRDAFNTVRALAEEEFVSNRDELVQHLIQDLTPFITGKVRGALAPIETATAAVPAVTPTPPTETATPTPAETPTPTPTAVVTPTTVTAPPAADTTTQPAVTEPIEPSESAPAAADLPEAKPGDPSYAKVPQKNRIRSKLETAREPYLQLRKEDPTQAKAISNLLAACRSAFARGNFDESEQYVDSALKLLGIE